MNAAERRQFQRFELDVRLCATLSKSGTRIGIHGRGNDLSQTGLAVFLPVELAVGESIELELVLPYTTQSIVLQAVVRNRRSFTYGLEFVHPTAAQRSLISRACTALKFLE